MAEIVFRDMVQRAGRDGEFEIASSATSTEEIWNGVGNPVYPPARAELKKHGLSAGNKRAVQLTKWDAEHYDALIVMDDNNVRNATRLVGPTDKLVKLMEFVGSTRDVSDPWYTGDFGGVYQDIVEGLDGLMAALDGDARRATERAQDVAKKARQNG
jgi:protein-tyrosine phosphatase